MGGSAYYLYQDDSSGVIKKIDSQIGVLKKEYQGIQKLKFNSYKDIFIVGKMIKQADFVYIRYFTRLIFFYPWLRMSSAKIILEIPTPIINSIYECETRGIKFRLRKLLFNISFPRLFDVSTKIIEYAEEDELFIGNNKKKISIITNGIDICRYGLDGVEYIKNKYDVLLNAGNTLNVLVVANLAFWHGIDRFLYGLRDYYSCPHDYNIILHVVGDGAERTNLEKIVLTNRLDKYVIFYGLRDQIELYDLYQIANFAIGSAGLFRKSLSSASILKVREYCLYGVPFLIDYFDRDFDGANFVYKVESEESSIDINKVVLWYFNLVKNNPNLLNEMHNYVISNLTWDSKLLPILEQLDKNEKN